MGRVYLPDEDRERFGVAADLRGDLDALTALISFEAARAEEWYERGLALLPMLDWRSRACTAAMAGIYRRLLIRIQRDPAGVLRGRLSLPAREKAAVAVRALQGGRHERTRPATAPRVVVVGGGLAGLAAALDCADRGARVTLLERRNRLGGLTWSFRHGDRWIDNGQHVFLRCCDQYLSFLDRIGARSDVELPDRLDIPVAAPPAGRAGRPGSAGSAGALPAPLHLAGSLLRYPHVPPGRSPGRRAGGAGPAPARPRRPGPRPGDLRGLAGPPRPVPGQRGRPVGPDHGAHRQPAGRRGVAGHGGQGLPDRPAQRRRGAADIGWSRVPLGRLHGERAGAALARAGVEVRLGVPVRSIESGRPIGPAGHGRAGLAVHGHRRRRPVRRRRGDRGRPPRRGRVPPAPGRGAATRTAWPSSAPRPSSTSTWSSTAR